MTGPSARRTWLSGPIAAVPRVLRAASSPREGEADVVLPHAHMKGFQLTTVGPTIGRETSRHNLRVICIDVSDSQFCRPLDHSSTVDREGHRRHIDFMLPRDGDVKASVESV